MNEEGDDLVHNPALFDSQAWMVIGSGYRPLVHELETAPRSLTKNPGAGATTPAMVIVKPPRKGRTGKRSPDRVYGSLRAAMQDNGRWVRTSIETGKKTEKGRAVRVQVKKRGTMKDESTPHYVMMNGGALGRMEGGCISPTREKLLATAMTYDQAMDLADAIGAGVCTIDKDGEIHPVPRDGDDSPRRSRKLPNQDHLPKAAQQDSPSGYPRIYSPDPLPSESQAKRRQRVAATVEKEVFGAPIHGDVTDEKPELISEEIHESE